jgi:hypothetical protein
MFETSFTSTKSPVPGTQNGSFELPQDVSLFLSGAWTTHIGSFLQVTYNTQDDHFSIDNTDIRYANTTKWGGKELVYGLNVNNNPTIEDLWCPFRDIGNRTFRRHGLHFSARRGRRGDAMEGAFCNGRKDAVCAPA